MKKNLLFGIVLLASCTLSSKPVLAIEKSNNPLVDSILSTYNSKPIPKQPVVVNTYSSQKVSNFETGNQDTGTRIEIRSLSIDEKIKAGNILNEELLVGSNEILTNTINGVRVIYAHNGMDKFGQLYSIPLGDKITLTTGEERLAYYLKQKVLLDSRSLGQLKAAENTVYLITCSYSQPRLRYLLQFEK